MKEQIIKLMEAEGLSSAKFADEIGVQRSSISHIISGRNKPSYDFILKILNRFSGLNTEWLLTGKGSMIKSNNSEGEDRQPAETLFSNDEEKTLKGEPEINTYKPISKIENETLNKRQETDQILKQNQKQNTQITNVNNINYILVFYRDGTFNQYNARE